MALRTLNQLKQLINEPQLMHKWEIQVPTWPPAAAPANPELPFFITSSGMPEAEYEDAVVTLGGFTINYNGKETRNGQITWTFFENTSGEVLQYFLVDYANARQQHNANEGTNLQSASTLDLTAPVVYMNLYAADGLTIAKRVVLVNVMFQIAGVGGELAQDATPQQPEVTVTYDDWHYENV